MNPNTQENTPQPGQQQIQGPSQFAGDQSSSRSTIPVNVHPSPSLTQRRVAEDIINVAVSKIPNAILVILKHDLGLAGKDVSDLDDKERILSAFRARDLNNLMGDGVGFGGAGGRGDVIDPTLVFRPDGDINFERDFAQWFYGGDSLDLK